jgi:protein involved in polysaccharide export with SLBB domain
MLSCISCARARLLGGERRLRAARGGVTLRALAVLVLSAATPAALAIAAEPEIIDAYPAPAAQPPVSPPGTADVLYRIQAGDVLEIKSFYHPEINEKIQVRPDNRISLVLVGDIVAVGLTPSELGQQLAARYARVLKEPDVSVLVREFAGQRVYVGGEVRSPALVPLNGRLTALQALTIAGGPLPSAKLHSVLILRATGVEQPVARQVDLQRVIDAKEPDPLLLPYDVIYVPKTVVARVDQFLDRYFDAIIPDSINFSGVYNLRPQVEVKSK